MSRSLVETGVSFTSGNGSRWMKHTVGLDIDYVRSHLDPPALDEFDSLVLMQKLLVVRAVTELSVCRFRQTRHDPDYDPTEFEAWRSVIVTLVGDEGIGRLGV